MLRMHDHLKYPYFVAFYENRVKVGLTVYTYELGNSENMKPRRLELSRKVRILLDEFSNRFVSGPNLPKSEELDNAIKKILGVK
jgi:hypothetical protein